MGSLRQDGVRVQRAPWRLENPCKNNDTWEIAQCLPAGGNQSLHRAWVSNCCAWKSGRELNNCRYHKLINIGISVFIKFLLVRYLCFDLLCSNHSYNPITIDPGEQRLLPVILRVQHVSHCQAGRGNTPRWTLGLCDGWVWKSCTTLGSHGFCLCAQLCLLSARTVCEWEPREGHPAAGLLTMQPLVSSGCLFLL